ncbi:hypothetical protein DPMN_057199 [Dreissena polymorpha]|uniref:Uncharacterized protein n=1 Tax=Dreissena polymorpha TaxID=45954 RepID=A0A9D4CUN8_DREPO|nr:hypothetical protein DPMN_057199 [Dreissena polymorpha]
MSLELHESFIVECLSIGQCQENSSKPSYCSGRGLSMETLSDASSIPSVLKALDTS